MAAPTTDVMVAQLAFDALGSTVAIASVTGSASKEEKIVARHYETVRDDLLAEAPWDFGNKRVEPTEVDPADWASATVYGASTGGSNNAVLYDSVIYASLQAANTNHQPDESPTWWQPLTRDEWTYVYELPSDFLAIEYIYPRKPRVPYFLGAHPVAGRLLWTNEEDAVLQYRAKVTAIASWPAQFVKAFRYRLAREMCEPLTVDAKRVALIEARAARALNEALATCLRQTQDDDDDVNDSSFQRARG